MANCMSDLLDCIVCREERQNLRLLKCNHSFCLQCLQSLLKNGKVQCPVCRQSHKISNIKQLPVDFRHQGLKEFAQNFIGEGKNQLCGLCKFQKKIRTASSFCEECLEFFCEECSKSHAENVLTDDHAVVAVSSPNYGMSSLCDEHMRPVKAVCFTCQKSVCSYCLLLNKHTDHDVKNPKDEETRKRLSLAFRDCEADIKTLIIDCGQQRQILQESETVLKQMYDINVREIQNRATATVKRIRREELSLLQELATVYKKKQTKMQIKISENQCRHDKTNEWFSVLQENEQAEYCKLYNVHKNISENVNKLKRQLSNRKDTKTVDFVKFDPNSMPGSLGTLLPTTSKAKLNMLSIEIIQLNPKHSFADLFKESEDRSCQIISKGRKMEVHLQESGNLVVVPDNGDKLGYVTDFVEMRPFAVAKNSAGNIVLACKGKAMFTSLVLRGQPGDPNNNTFRVFKLLEQK